MKTPTNPTGVVWHTIQVMKRDPHRMFFPVQIARELKITWIEAALALWVCVELKTAIKRRDGRFVYVEPVRINPSDSFRAWLKTKDGERCVDPASLKIQEGNSTYLENRLWFAFVAGQAAGR